MNAALSSRTSMTLRLVNQASFRAELKERLVATCMPDSELYAFLSLLSDTGKSLRYEYTSSLAGKVILFEFTNDEIKEMMNNQ